MSGVDLPHGKYFSMVGLIRADAGGQTRAMLMRNRLFAQHAGIAPTLLTFDPFLEYPAVRAGLREQGQLVDPMELTNIYEWYREHSIDHLTPIGMNLPDLSIYESHDDPHPDGTVFRTRYLDRWTGKEKATDYRRPDGSVFIRLPSGDNADTNPVTPVILSNSHGQVISEWPKKSGWHRHWLRTLTPEGMRAFVISDSRYALAHIVGIRDRRFHLIHLMHSAHTSRERRWNSPLAADYAPLLASIPKLAGLVNLTQRQSAEISERCGDTDNLFVVPNPVDVPAVPEDLQPRQQKKIVLITRLEPVKRVDEAIRAFARVVEMEPDATMDVYGSGNLHVRLQRQIDDLGLSGSVRLMGYDRRATDALWTATAMLMTSRLEGYPLAVLESMARGCPVISYDFKYGPREQITDGVDGYVVDNDDAPAMADRIVQLMRDRELLTAMSKAALEKARAHDETAFLRDWRHVITTVITNRPTRTKLRAVDLKVRRLTAGRLWSLPNRLRHGATSSGSLSPRASVRFVASLSVDGSSKKATLESARLTLSAVCDDTGAVHRLPLRVRRASSDFRLSARFTVADIFEAMPADTHSVRLRLRLVWHNSSWETYLSRNVAMRPRYEVAFTADDEMHLHQRKSQGGPDE